MRRHEKTQIENTKKTEKYYETVLDKSNYTQKMKQKKMNKKKKIKINNNNKDIKKKNKYRKKKKLIFLQILLPALHYKYQWVWWSCYKFLNKQTIG